MKNRMAALLGPAFGISYEVSAEGGGGTAVAIPPASGGAGASGAPSSTTAAASGGGTDTGSGTPGMFGGIVAPTVKIPEKTGASPDPTGKTTPDSGKDKAAPAATPGRLSRKLLGRYETEEAAEEALRRSQDEGVRLDRENRTLRDSLTKDKSELETQLSSLRAELEAARKATPFQELTGEELKALAKEDPAAAADYIAEKKLRDRDAIAAKTQREQSARAEAQSQARMKDLVRRQDEARRSDPERWPQYTDLQPTMEKIMERLTEVGGDGQRYSPITGYEWTGELLYHAALGIAYKNALRTGGKVQADAADAAARKAAADAAAGRGPSGSGKTDGGEGQTDPDAAWRSAVLAAAPRRVFSKRT